MRTLEELIDESKGMTTGMLRYWFEHLPKEEQDEIRLRYVYLADQHSPAPDFRGDR